MDDLSHSEVVHLQVDDHLPAIPMAFPAAEVLKQILEQLLENERRRVRNEFIRISSFFLVLLLLVMAGGFWISRDILSQVKEARLMSEHSQEALMTLLAAANRRAPAASPTPRPEVRQAQSQPAATPDENPAEIQKVIADLEGKNKALAELMQTQNGNLKNLLLDVLKTRDAEIRNLRARVNSKQAGAIAYRPVDLDAISAQQPAKPTEKPEPPAVKVTLPDRPPVKTLTAPVANDLPLRLPIPSP